MSVAPSAARPRARLRWLPLAWGLGTAALLVALGPGLGISDAEASALAAARASPGTAGASAVASTASPVPPLPAMLLRAAGWSAARLGAPRLAGYRLASAVAGGLLAALVSLIAMAVAGPAAGALAPALLLSAPRLLAPLVQAGPAAPGAALAAATVLAYHHAASARRTPARLAAALAAGALFALALSAQLQALQLLAVAAVHVLVCGLRRAFGPAQAGEVPVEDGEPPLRAPLHALAAMAVLGVGGAIAFWPSLWTAPLPHLAQAVAALRSNRPPLRLGLGLPVVVTGLALPAGLAAAFAGGLLHAIVRGWRAFRRGGAEFSDELLLVLAALGPFAAAQLGLSGRTPGPGAWLAAFPFLAVLGARAVLASARALWPSRAAPIAASVSALVLASGVVATVRAYPLLGSSWGELAGGTPGAATLGLARQDGGAIASLLPELAAHARPGARVYWAAVPAATLWVYAQDGRIRPDLSVAAAPDDADLAVVPLGGSRQEEYRVWASFHSSTPATGAFLDEVPLAWVFARPGAWR